MFSIVAFAVVLQATVSILCEQTVSDSTEFHTTSKFSVLLLDSVFQIRSNVAIMTGFAYKMCTDTRKKLKSNCKKYTVTHIHSGPKQ